MKTQTKQPDGCKAVFITLTTEDAPKLLDLDLRWFKFIRCLELINIKIIGRAFHMNKYNEKWHIHAILNKEPATSELCNITKTTGFDCFSIQKVKNKTMAMKYLQGYTLTELMACILIAVALLGIGMGTLGWVKSAWEQHNDPTTPIGQLYSANKETLNAAQMLETLGATNSVGGVQ